MEALTPFLPLISVLAPVVVLATISYWFGSRTRRRTKREEIFHNAIATVAEAEASINFMYRVDWTGGSPDGIRDLADQLGREGAERHARCVNSARAAVARASAYDPTLAQYYRKEVNGLLAHATAIIDRLTTGM